jgi:hypothetical protein
MKRLVVLASLLLLAGCARAPQAVQAPLAAPEAQAAKTLKAMEPAVAALMDRCFDLMTYGAKPGFDAADLDHYTAIGEEKATALVKSMDRDGDAKATRGELGQWGLQRNSLSTMRDAVVAPAFKAADVDGDRQLTPTEAAQATLSLGNQGTWPLGVTTPDFKAADQDHDGRLSPQEFNTLASTKVVGGLKADTSLPPRLGKFFFGAIPWSH